MYKLSDSSSVDTHSSSDYPEDYASLEDEDPEEIRNIMDNILLAPASNMLTNDGSSSAGSDNSSEMSVSDLVDVAAASAISDVRDHEALASESHSAVLSKKERFVVKVADNVRSALENATKVVGKERNNILKELFSDIATEIEDSVRDALSSDPSTSCDSEPLPTYYYELLAERYYAHPEEVKALQHVIVALIGNTNFPIIYAALFHRWIFKRGIDRLKSWSLFVKGLNRLFWFDLETVSHRFTVIYKLLKNRVLLNQSMWDPSLRRSSSSSNMNITNVNNASSGSSSSSNSNHASSSSSSSNSNNYSNEDPMNKFFGDCFNLVARFFLYYERADDMAPFLAKMQNTFDKYGTVDNFYIKTAKADSTITGISAADLFAQCVIRQISYVKNEYILLRYIQNCAKFQGLCLSGATRVKLQSMLYSFASPGGPAYAPRSVRIASRISLDTLFPNGKLARKAIYFVFRLFHPYHSTKSFLHWLYSFVKPFVGFFGPTLEEEEEEATTNMILMDPK